MVEGSRGCKSSAGVRNAFAAGLAPASGKTLRIRIGAGKVRNYLLRGGSKPPPYSVGETILFLSKTHMHSDRLPHSGFDWISGKLRAEKAAGSPFRTAGSGGRYMDGGSRVLIDRRMPVLIP